MAKHLLGAPWLIRASELAKETGRSGESAHCYGEPVELRRTRGGAEVVLPRELRWPGGRRRWKGSSRRRVVGILDRWREVRGWWGEEGTDRVVFRVLLTGEGRSGGMVADLARERGNPRGKSEGWLLVGVAD